VAKNRLTLPNVITLVRIAVCPVIFWMAVSPSVSLRFWSFVLFVAAGLSDVWDGYLARRYDLITDMGKLLDPFADKLLLVATFVPFYIVSHRGGPQAAIPWWGPMPVWVLVVIFGRELFVTLFRGYAAGRGVVIAAGKSGKNKSLLQSLFIGGLLFWYPIRMFGDAEGWSGALWDGWLAFHGAWIGVTLALALVLTVYSMMDYLWSYRSLVGIRG
jgi:CDP-diacylglycerol---glycerol-3-phosphate 3-phosphatidyltransferase